MSRHEGECNSSHFSALKSVGIRRESRFFIFVGSPCSAPRDCHCFFVFLAGVSCDSCIKGNFRGLRFKCLICYDYDLCATCFEAGATNTRHTADHPMQCILTRADYGPSISSDRFIRHGSNRLFIRADTYYGGESISSDTPQSYSCPYCGKLGYTETVLYDHVTTEHNETPYEVVRTRFPLRHSTR